MAVSCGSRCRRSGPRPTRRSSAARCAAWQADLTPRHTAAIGRSPRTYIRSVTLHVLAGNCQEGDKAGDHDREDQADPPVAPAQATQADGLADPVGERSAQRAGDDIGEPEGEDRGPAAPPVADGGDGDY